MPAGYEYHLDYRVIDAAAWDHVSLVDMETNLEEASQLPNDLRGAVEYLDLSESLSLQVSYVGALQLAPWYERLIDRGVRGSVIYAPNEEIYEVASTIIATCSMVGGGLPDGYRLSRTPIALRNMHHYLDQGAITNELPSARVA
ncbi:MAG: hypothetical protein ABGZ49_17475 [Akkermansiaceae bacterium]|jgi:hypothetical protein|nr:hypothetical protein [Roseibacillus sp.]|tara:strand:- start:305 stop:736 length:432 start_codon:yes stop_codon:yes gene_type:complete